MYIVVVVPQFKEWFQGKYDFLLFKKWKVVSDLYSGLTACLVGERGDFLLLGVIPFSFYMDASYILLFG